MSEWISVKDRLPDDEDELVLIYDKNIDYVGIGYYDDYRDCWIDDSIYDNYEYENVTHWMPLPEPPKE